MIELFKSLFGGTTVAASRPKSAGRGASNRSKLGADFRAVSLLPALECQAAGRGGVDKRYLLREAPSLPLAGCATPERCT
ncbi:MAG TPA: hypothetical protein VGH84_09420, partial [Steroidobacteraceae bacterium]